VNLLSAALAVSATAFYVLVYTMWLKRSSSENIVIGGAAGAVPVLVGWSAVTDSLAWAPIIMFGIIFLWTPPHFWALAVKYRDDYTKAEVPMLPSVMSMEGVTRRILIYTVALWRCPSRSPGGAPRLGLLRRRHGARRAAVRLRLGTAQRPHTQAGDEDVRLLDHVPCGAVHRHGAIAVVLHPDQARRSNDRIFKVTAAVRRSPWWASSSTWWPSPAPPSRQLPRDSPSSLERGAAAPAFALPGLAAARR